MPSPRLVHKRRAYFRQAFSGRGERRDEKGGIREEWIFIQMLRETISHNFIDTFHILENSCFSEFCAFGRNSWKAVPR